MDDRPLGWGLMGTARINRRVIPPLGESRHSYRTMHPPACCYLPLLHRVLQ